jgi:hypothetical protein
MAHEDKRANKPKRTGRTTVLAGLLAIVAVVAAYLSDCIPGFGLGSRSGDGEGEQAEPADAKPAEPADAKPAEDEQAVEPAPIPERKPMPLKLTIDARGCAFADGQPIDCATLCDRPELFEGADSVIIDATNGPHGVVVDVLDCLKSLDLSVSIKRK